MKVTHQHVLMNLYQLPAQLLNCDVSFSNIIYASSKHQKISFKALRFYYRVRG